MSLNAPKSERISQRHLESTQSEVPKPVVKPSAEFMQVVRGKGVVRAADVFADFQGNLRGKPAENFGAT